MLKKKLGIEAIEGDLYNDEELTKYFKIPSTLTIPEGCVRIGNFAFWRCEELEKVVIPKSVGWIGLHAFWGCKNATIILKKHKKDFEEIDELAFYGCKDVKEKVRN